MGGGRDVLLTPGRSVAYNLGLTAYYGNGEDGEEYAALGDGSEPGLVEAGVEGVAEDGP